ncbi:MAG: hypothetical protein HY298_26010 [Verrucomicrobia bacterium]|nr:hypothetical protein [Verrucomicrobiota bacterium]
MNLLDENFPEDQLPQLRAWRIPVRRIGHDFAQAGVKDPDILPLLHRLGRVTFFSLDWDFFKQSLCHPAYGLVWLDVRADDAAHFLRRFLKHSRFDTQAKRMGTVVRAHHDGFQFWQWNRPGLRRVGW